MRKGSTSIILAFLAGKSKRLKNDHTDGTGLVYHGNTIAIRTREGKIEWTLAGWNTVSTRERINTLLRLLDAPFGVCQHQHEPCVYVHNWGGGDYRRIPIDSRNWYSMILEEVG